MAHVADLDRSIAFYARLGFTIRNTFTPDGASAPTWAMLEAGNVRLMVVLADEPVDASVQAVLFYLYFEDIAAVHASLAEAGLDVGPLDAPPHSPNGEFRLLDPDGYCLMLAHT
jgi:hypothetical protein